MRSRTKGGLRPQWDVLHRHVPKLMDMADDRGVSPGAEAPHVQVGNAGVAWAFDLLPHFLLQVVVVASRSTAEVSRMRLQDQLAMTSAPTIPITGSSQVQPTSSFL